MERRVNELKADLEAHMKDAYAHTPMTSRMVTERDVRLTNVETRIGTLERFRAQATLLGGLAMVILGALAYAVVDRIVTKGW